jgi:hypothetical protein
VRYTEDYEQQKGKGSFPAMITPAYQIARRASELASDVSAHGYVVMLRRKQEVKRGLEVQLPAYFCMPIRTKEWLSFIVSNHF